MHGIVHRSLKQYVIDRASDDSWDVVSDLADVDTDMYLPVSEYPDREVVDVLEAVADLTGHPPAAVQRDFGGYFAPQMLDTFSALVRGSWDGMDVVANLDRIYPQVVSKDGDAESVTVETRRPDEDTVLVEFSSERDLGGMVEGIVRGVAREYDLDVEVHRERSSAPDDPDYTVTVRRT